MMKAGPRQGQEDRCGTERETEGTPWLAWMMASRKVAGSGNGWFTVMGMPKKQLSRADDDFRLRYVWSASGIQRWPISGRNGIFRSEERVGLEQSSEGAYGKDGG